MVSEMQYDGRTTFQTLLPVATTVRLFIVATKDRAAQGTDSAGQNSAILGAELVSAEMPHKSALGGHQRVIAVTRIAPQSDQRLDVAQHEVWAGSRDGSARGKLSGGACDVG